MKEEIFLHFFVSNMQQQFKLNPSILPGQHTTSSEYFPVPFLIFSFIPPIPAYLFTDIVPFLRGQLDLTWKMTK